MAHILCLENYQPHHHPKLHVFCKEEIVDDVCHGPCMLTLDAWVPQMPYKRPKTDVVGDTGPVGLPRLGFRDHVKSYKQRLVNDEGLDAIAGIEVEVGGGGGGDAMDLVRMLISCAEAVACRDRAQASALLTDLRAQAQVLGTSFQRVAFCFVTGLSDRLSMVGPLGSLGSMGLTKCWMPGPSPEWDEALGLAYKLCPIIRFGHFVANESMLEALAGESSAHVVDLGMSLGLPMGHQWRDLIQRLVDRPGPLMRRIRLTGVGPRAERLESIGDGLVDFARGLGLELEFRAIVTSLEGLRLEDIKAEKGEALVVNSVLELHHVVKESRGALNSVLRTVHRLEPRVLVLVEQDVNHNGPFFMGRFMEALHYYSAVFDALDMALPRYDTRRAKMEQFYFAEEIRNIVSCEGPARVERHERADQWRRRMSRAGFQPSPVKMGAQAKGWLGREGEGAHGFTVVEDKGCLTLAWKSKPIVTASCWKC